MNTHSSHFAFVFADQGPRSIGMFSRLAEESRERIERGRDTQFTTLDQPESFTAASTAVDA